LTWLSLAVFLVVVAAAVAVRRKIKDPASPLGQWCVKNLRPRMARAAKGVAYLTLAAWVLIYLFAPKEERGSFGDLVRDFQKAIGLEGGLEGKKTPDQPSPDPPSLPPPPFRIPGPEETAKPGPARR